MILLLVKFDFSGNSRPVEGQIVVEVTEFPYIHGIGQCLIATYNKKMPSDDKIETVIRMPLQIGIFQSRWNIVCRGLAEALIE